MKKNYISVEVKCDPQKNELLIAEMSILGFDSFLEDNSGFQAGIAEQKFSKEHTEKIISKYNEHFPVTINIVQVKDTNWNEYWEKNFPFVIIENKVLVKASFHKVKKAYPFEITINPKMSFGTGHHESTYMMIQAMLELTLREKTVLDAGCGTGILSILAEKMGAEKITAVDIDDKAVTNAEENIRINKCRNISVYQSTTRELQETSILSDVLLANINRNVLLDEIPAYTGLMAADGILVLSGFYSDDIPLLENICLDHGLARVTTYTRNKWAALVFQKKSDYFSTKY